MQLNVQRRLAARILKCSPLRVRFDENRLDEIKESITKVDLRRLVNDNAIQKIQKKGISHARANYIKKQRQKGRRKGLGSRKGLKTARTPSKREWMNRIRLQREFLYLLREKGHVTGPLFRELYLKAKGGYFRSKRHIKLYLEEHNLVAKP
ncbi:50S ribosomal protein L19e [Candidatus Woesearchaeota archaeon]|nr:50S ribosomal protein L19e [Candidatus Woesearchaeota archaeon]